MIFVALHDKLNKYFSNIIIKIIICGFIYVILFIILKDMAKDNKFRYYLIALIVIDVCYVIYLLKFSTEKPNPITHDIKVTHELSNSAFDITTTDTSSGS